MFRWVACCAFLLLKTVPAFAISLEAPQGPVLLTVTGAVPVTNAPEGAQFDLHMLESIGTTTFTTATIWTEGAQRFTGVSLHDLIQALQVTEGSLRAVAINEYSAEIPLEDAVPEGPIIAWARNGSLMSVRDKGPLWIVYPFDDYPEYRSEIIFARSIWQLSRIVIEP
ncbi:MULTISPECIES: molybdopterin-dependent oxidoreductase [unclassified Salipiger]|uniref:molybdopterin-dependent oxidoreductase n=1 Tax=unclassified Salipiger TaxID=2640570 RepID=UPI0013B86E1D|nr:MULTISPECIES: molybdopterin-dependent oxidoreductase [unclassified Salipiger]NDV50430.1 molybdopterin-dependent oxidoreductase [Salipiger sp. PrR003]NDW32614.1 molybdopterin-dependent oxidoreductase [Salipiger sp. PrR007]